MSIIKKGEFKIKTIYPFGGRRGVQNYKAQTLFKEIGFEPKYGDSCSKMHLFQALFLDFQIQQLAILKPVEVGKSYIPQKKAL